MPEREVPNPTSKISKAARAICNQLANFGYGYDSREKVKIEAIRLFREVPDYVAVINFGNGIILGRDASEIGRIDPKELKIWNLDHLNTHGKSINPFWREIKAPHVRSDNANLLRHFTSNTA